MDDDQIVAGAFDAADRDTGMRSYAEVATRAAIPLARQGYVPAGESLSDETRAELRRLLDNHDAADTNLGAGRAANTLHDAMERLIGDGS